MNYYNPYFYTMPNVISTPKVGLFSRIFGGKITLSGILNGTQRALNFANQAIPLVKQVRPMIGNAKTMFKVMNEFKKADTPAKKMQKEENNFNVQEEKENTILNDNQVTDNGPTFFI